MKIGILSMQRILNYGSFFQAYSLKTMLESLGHDVVFVDYKIDWTIETRRYYKKVSLAHLRMLKRILFHRHNYEIVKSNPSYKYFLVSYKKLGLSSKYHFRTPVDILVIGSDEVFNCLQNNEDVGYSLELFGKNNRAKKLMSYAASFGNTTLESLNYYGVSKEIRHYLKRFDAISVRDQNSAAIITGLCGITPYQHFDPALIGNLENMKWTDCSIDHFMVVYGYIHRFTDEEGSVIMSFARKKHLKVIILNAPQSFGDEFILCSPDEVLGYFSKAEYVVTDTFHGTIFSVIFHKHLAIFCRTEKDTFYSNSNKLIDLIDKLGLRSQLVKAPHDLENILCQEIDYDAVDQVRAVERERAIAYLKKECGEVNGIKTSM